MRPRMRDDVRVRVRVDGLSLHFDVDGCGLVPVGDTMVQRPTLVLLHGGPGADHSVFKPEFSTMTDIAQVVYLDQRGSGRSDDGEPAAWNWPRWADDVAEFCDQLGLTRVALVGTSSGGLVGLHCAARHPQLVAALVLDSALGPATVAETLEVFERRGGPLALRAATRYLGGDTGDEAARAWQEHAVPLYAGLDDGDMAARRSRARINDDVQTHFRRGGCGPVDPSPLAGSVTCPVLILAGEDDPIAPAAGARRLAASLSSAQVTLRVMAGVGHGVFRQAPQAAFPILREFLYPGGAAVTPGRPVGERGAEPSV